MSLKYALLGQLARGPQTGYGLAKSFAGSLNYAWPASRSQIYPELARLRESGLIRQTASGPRSSKVYETTPKGLSELRHWLRETEPERLGRNEPLLRIFLLWLLEHDEAEAYLRRERELLQLELDELEGIAAEDDPREPAEKAAALALEHGLRILRTRIGWVDWALAEIAGWPEAAEEAARQADSRRPKSG
jgi:PadR family transcriptional regulator, regulatory protein AphA